MITEAILRVILAPVSLILGADFVVVEVYNWRGNKLGGPYKLYAGDKKGGSYYFGEWSYSYSVSLEWSEMN